MKIVKVAVLRIEKKIATEKSPENMKNHDAMKRLRREEFEKKRNGKRKRNLEVKVILVSYQVWEWGSLKFAEIKIL